MLAITTGKPGGGTGGVMSDGFEANPEAIRALTTAFAEAQHQTDQIKAELEKPSAEAKDFGRSWADPFGTDFVDAMGAIAADLANLSKLFADVQAAVGQTSDLMVAGETASVGSFREIGSDSGTDTGTGGGSTSEGI
jgi:uncharacterized protein YukE